VTEKKKLTIRYNKTGMYLKVFLCPEEYEYELKDWGEK
jgi:hypothetical protein